MSPVGLQIQETDIAIIGGGIVGCAVAYNLARRGAKVVLLEKGRFGDEQSSRNMGAVRQQARDPVETPLMMECIRIWKELEPELEADIEWVQGGNLGLAADDAEMARFEEAFQTAQQFGLDSRLVSSAEIKQMVPRMESTWRGGLFTASDGHASPGKASEAFVQAAGRHGAVLEPYCAVEGFEQSNGRISAVLTGKGRLKVGAVVCAAGAHSFKLARMLGLDLPIRVVRSTVAETEPLPPITKAHVWGEGFVIRQRPNGQVHLNFHSSRAGEYDITLDSFRHLRLFLPVFLQNRTLLRVRVGKALLADILRRLPGAQARRRPFSHTVDVEPATNPRTVERCRETFSKHFPGLGEVPIHRTWAGNIDCTPDLLPVLGPVSEVAGFYFATAFSGHGFAMGPLMGRLLTEWILDGKPSLDLHAMRYTRFAEGDIRIPKNLI